MEHQSFYFILSLSLSLSLSLIFLGSGPVVGAAADDLTTKCSEVVEKVIPCLSFAQGQTAVPTKDCCDAAASIKASSPECMCYIIQQTHKGNAQSKNLGIKEDRLLQLPSACKLKANVSDCPKLLGLPADSPDAAIFKNTNSSSATPATGANDTSTATNSTASPGSIGSMLHPPLFAEVLAVAFAVVLVAIPTSGFLSVFT